MVIYIQFNLMLAKRNFLRKRRKVSFSLLPELVRPQIVPTKWTYFFLDPRTYVRTYPIPLRFFNYLLYIVDGIVVIE